jgi:hypothetical protein
MANEDKAQMPQMGHVVRLALECRHLNFDQHFRFDKARDDHGCGGADVTQMGAQHGDDGINQGNI